MNTPNALAGCGSCKVCCKVMKVTELDKPGCKWCEHVDLRGEHGCTIYETRPQSCREFECIWLQAQHKGAEGWPAELRPDRSHVVFDTTHGDQIGAVIHVDPAYPNAWQQGVAGRKITAMIAKREVLVVVITGDRREVWTPEGLHIKYREGDTLSDATTLVLP